MKAYEICRRMDGLAALGALVLALASHPAGGATGVSGGPPRADAPDLAAIHDGNSPSYQKNCLGCHADIMKKTTLDKKFKEAHRAMIPFAPGYAAKAGATSEVCASCHAKVDLLEHSAALIRRNVGVAACAACHGKSGPSSKKFYMN